MCRHCDKMDVRNFDTNNGVDMLINLFESKSDNEREICASSQRLAPTTYKRLLILTCVPQLLLCIAVMHSQTPSPGATDSSAETFLEITTLPLWDRADSKLQNSSENDQPTLTIFRPQPGTETGTAVIVAPGGGYLALVGNLEGRQPADWLAQHGILAFVLKYRLGEQHLYPQPLLDAQRAIRLLRYRAKEFGISSNRIGIMGFSAGGHLAATAGTLFDDGSKTSNDPIEQVSSRPDFMILAYPWLNAMQPNDRGLITYCTVLHNVSSDQCKSFTQKYTPVLHVTSRTSPTFIYHTTDDQTVPVEASVAFYLALRSAGVSVEMHTFANGAHGSGLGMNGPGLDLWPGLLEAWLRKQGYLNKPGVSTTFH